VTAPVAVLDVTTFFPKEAQFDFPIMPPFEGLAI
jgi:hypothetical protein